MDKLLKMIVTYRFVIILNTLLGQGIDIVSCLQIIRYYQNDNMVALVGYHFNESLLAGNSFEDSLALEYLDEEFSSICMWGYKSDEFIKALGDYQEIIELKSMQKINQLAMTFQILCYTFIGAIVILAYQVLLLPLELLNGF